MTMNNEWDMVHLCYTCIHAQDCWEAHNRYPILDCNEFESEDTYPDGDAYAEYMGASLFGKEPIGHGD